MLVGAKSDVQNYYKAAKLLVHAGVAGEGLPTIILKGIRKNFEYEDLFRKIGSIRYMNY